jgi:carbamoyltransferase
LEIVNETRSSIPAVTHVDYSARIQTVDGVTKPDYYALISEFKEITGCGVIANTSFNVRGEPIVCSHEDAYRCFMRTEMDMLVIEDYLLFKSEQPKYEESVNWREEYELD